VSPRRKVALVFTGGTIESVGRDRLDLAWYIENNTRLTNAQVRERVPELETIADVHEVPFRKLPSHALVDADWLELVAAIHEIVDRDPDCGVVLVHGTNTLEETAYFLHLTLRTSAPVVLTGSMRPASAVSADGDMNLVNAVAVAAAPASRGKGVLVVLNDTIFSARDVTKTSTYRLHSFQARDLGPLGYADNDRSVLFHHEPLRPHTGATPFDVSGLDSLPRVDVVVSYVGADGTMTDAAVAAGARGIVSAGTGAGRPTPAEEAAFLRAREQGVAVCIASRVGSGRVVRSPGFRAKGFVASGDLVPWKARALLALALTRTDDPDELQELFDTY
jgi:L-asparaginase